MTRPNFQFKITNNGEMTHSTTTHIKTRISSKTRGTLLKEGDIMSLLVTYKQGVTNSGNFKTKTDLLKCLNDWTDKQQLDYVYGKAGGKW